MNVKVNHRLGVTNVKYFNNFNMTLKYDALGSTFGFGVYFDPKNREHAEMACVSHFHEAIVEHNGEVLVTGYILSQAFNRSSKKELVQFGGYSKPGVFEDCCLPPELYPLETNGLSLESIARRIASYFKINVIVDQSAASVAGKAIAKTNIKPTQKIGDYLVEIATQKHLILSHNEKGDLVIKKVSDTTNKKPILEVSDGIIGTKISLNFNGQAIHSHITVMKQADSKGGNAGEYTIKNPYCPIVKRPLTITQSSGDDISVSETAKNELANELKNVGLTIEIDRWDINGKIIRPDNLVRVYSPENFIYKPTDFFIESVRYEGDNEKMTAELTCVLPEVYNGNPDKAKNIFVDVHENFPRFNYNS
jgi:prophage tail gpP-like protein